MKISVKPTSKEQMLNEHSFMSEVDNWYYSIDEISANCFKLTGQDIFGRKIKDQGDNPKNLLAKFQKKATEINESISST